MTAFQPLSKHKTFVYNLYNVGPTSSTGGGSGINEWSFCAHVCICAHIYLSATLGHENLPRMARWMRWHCTPVTVLKIRAPASWCRGRYLSVTEAPHNTESFVWGSWKMCFCQSKLCSIRKISSFNSAFVWGSWKNLSIFPIKEPPSVTER